MLCVFPLFFRQFGTCFGLFDIAEKIKFTYIISKKYFLIAIDMKQARKACQKFTFLPVSKAHTSDNTCVYIYDISIKNLCLKSNLRTVSFHCFSLSCICVYLYFTDCRIKFISCNLHQNLFF
jgi:hypothetical protein